MANSLVWPAANQYMEAIQNPLVCFSDPVLHVGTPAVDRLGMPVVMSGNFAYVFKLHVGHGARAIKCFRQFLGDREVRYHAIDDHLDTHRIPALAQFEYDPDGILVAGKRYPIVIMEWVDGNTLDTYIATLVQQQRAKDHLKALADQWSELAAKLESADVAHGDLQHGNVIVTQTGSLKLVDLDGMYVPDLVGRQTTELGHIHYQHPKRSQAPFDKRLDHFSSLVIYTSLLALDHDPSLWDRFHDDEHLIFKKSDFAEPSRSRLFRVLSQQGGEVARLTEVLATACAKPSSAATPPLSTLVQVKVSRLPEWMRSSAVVTVQTKTREATAASAALPPASASPSLGSTSAPSSAKTPTPASRQSAVGTSIPAAGTSIQVSDDWIGRGLNRGLKLAVYWWWTGLIASQVLLGVAQALGATSGGAWFPAILIYLAVFIGVGLIVEGRSRSLAPLSIRTVPAPPSAQTAVTTVRISTAIPGPTPISARSGSTPPVHKPAVPASTPYVPRVSSTASSPQQSHAAPVRATTASSTAAPRTAPVAPVSRPPSGQGAAGTTPSWQVGRARPGHVIASSIRMVYHRAGCEWATKISLRNRVLYGSSQDAIKYGCRPCRVCNP